MAGRGTKRQRPRAADDGCVALEAIPITSQWRYLPADVIIGVLDLLGPVRASLVRTVCRDWKQLVETTKSLWQVLDFRQWRAKITPRGLLFVSGLGAEHASELNVGCCPKLTNTFPLRDEDLSAVLSFCPRLQLLNVGNCRQLTDGAAKQIPGCCPDLQELSLQGCVSIGDDGVAGALGPHLERFNVSGMPLLSEEGIQRLRNLSRLVLEDSSAITGRGIASIIAQNPQLTELSLQGSEVVNALVLESLQQAENLRVLNLTSCCGLKPKMFQTWKPPRNLMLLLANRRDLAALQALLPKVSVEEGVMDLEVDRDYAYVFLTYIIQGVQ